MVLTQRNIAGFFESIPKRFHTTMVLTQQTTWTPDTHNYKSFHTTMVLTQLQTKSMASIRKCSFHTTMVLTQLRKVNQHLSDIVWFPYHYGSYATYSIGETLIFSNKFPYHYGSYATSR